MTSFSSGPSLFGCTPKSAVFDLNDQNVTINFSYLSNTYLVTKTQWTVNGVTGGSLNNTFMPFTTKFPQVIENSFISIRQSSMNFSMFYDIVTYAHLGSLVIVPTGLFGNEDVSRVFSTSKKPLNVFSSPYTSFDPESPDFEITVAYAYNQGDVPYQATNISITANDQVQTIFNQFTTSKNGAISKIVSTPSKGDQVTTYITYDPTSNLVTKICQDSCIAYTYDSLGRLESVTEDGTTLETYKFHTVNGVSQIQTAELGENIKVTFNY